MDLSNCKYIETINDTKIYQNEEKSFVLEKDGSVIETTENGFIECENYEVAEGVLVGRIKECCRSIYISKDYWLVIDDMVVDEDNDHRKEYGFAPNPKPLDPIKLFKMYEKREYEDFCLGVNLNHIQFKTGHRFHLYDNGETLVSSAWFYECGGTKDKNIDKWELKQQKEEEL